jgi:hypothetical protein
MITISIVRWSRKAPIQTTEELNVTEFEYYKLCDNYDYYYTYSDDHSVWKRGQQQSQLIQRNAHDHPHVYSMFIQYWNNGFDPRLQPHLDDLETTND